MGSGFRVQGSGFRVQGSGFRVQGSGFRVQGSGFRVCIELFLQEGCQPFQSQSLTFSKLSEFGGYNPGPRALNPLPCHAWFAADSVSALFFGLEQCAIRFV